MNAHVLRNLIVQIYFKNETIYDIRCERLSTKLYNKIIPS